MARDFKTVYEQILTVAPECLATDLKSNRPFWAPEVCWHNLTRYVHKYVELNSSSETSIAVYSILCDCSKEEIKEKNKEENKNG